MRFAIASEGRTDYIVLKNLLIGFFKDKNLPVTPLRPKDKEPFGWGNLLNYIASEDFRDDCDDENIDYVVIQVDTDKCEEWAGIPNIGSAPELTNEFAAEIAGILADRMGAEFYAAAKHKIIFAVCVHEIECWLLPFHESQKAKTGKLVGCAKALEQIAKKRGFSINEKNYAGGKHYEDLSKEMKDNKALMQKSKLNTGLSNFVAQLGLVFPGFENN